MGAASHVEGIHEKQVTLAVARLVRKRLERDGIQVVTTRDADTYLTLGERVRRANSSGADLFISLHANAAPDHARRGVETYLLSREVRDLEAQRASRQYGTGEAIDPVDAMQARAKVRFVAAESARLARSVQQRLSQAREGDRGVRQAPYDVLEGLTVPAALVEVGFIDHPTEGMSLLRPEVLRRIADAIADGVEDFSSTHDPLAP